MNKILLLIVTTVVMSLTWSCSPEERAERSVQTDLKNRIDSIEVFLFEKAEGKHIGSMKRLKNSYVKYAESYPKDEFAPLYYFQAADISQRLSNFPEAINYYQKIVDGYPEFKNYVESYFLIGVIYDNDLKDKNNARRIYNEVATKFPEHDFGKNAKTLIESKIMDLSEEELIEFLKEKNKEVLED